MRSVKLGTWGALALLMAAAPTAARADEAKPAAKWYDAIELSGMASVGYEYNFNAPQSGQNQLRAFDTAHNSFRLDVAELTVQKVASAPGDLGLRIDFAAGSGIPRATAARGLFRDEKTGQAGDFDLLQAFGSYIAPLGRGLRIDAGKFVTPAGIEVIEGHDGVNDNYSHSFLFTYGPYTHTGLKLSYSFNDHVSAMVMLVNGWDNVVDNNQAKSFGAQLAVTPNDHLSLILTYVGGPERDQNDGDMRHLVDFILQWKPHWRFSLGFNFDWALDENGVAPVAALMPPPNGTAAEMTASAAARAHDAEWLGGALYLHLGATHRFSLNLRAEAFWDRDGARTNTPQLLYGVTLTPEVRVTDKFIVRAEARIDISDHHVFDSGGRLATTQPTLALNAVYFVP